MPFVLANIQAHLYPHCEIISCHMNVKKEENFWVFWFGKVLLHNVILTILSTVTKKFTCAVVALLQVKYSSDQRQMKGRRSVLLDTPELRHVKETQNNISMVGYFLPMTRAF